MTTQPRRSPYTMGTLPNMLRSMLVMGLLVLAVWAIVPRISHVDRPEVDALGKAQDTAGLTGWAIEMPTGLGEDWRPTNAAYGLLTDDVPTLTTVWQAPDGDVALKQAVEATPAWVARSVNDGAAAGPVTIASRTWQSYVSSDGRQHGYVLTPSEPAGLTIAVTGTVPDEQLRAFLAGMKQVEPVPRATPTTSS